MTLGATVTDVGPVVLSASFPGGRSCRYVVSESQAGSHGKVAEVFACRELVRDLCRGFVPMCGPGGGVQSPSTVKQTVKAVRHLARVVDQRAGERAGSLRLRDLTTDDLKALEDRLVALNPGGKHAWAISRNLARLLVAVDEEWPGRVPGPVRQRTRFQTLPHPRQSPHEPFSPFVADQLRRACLADMKDVAARLREGAELLAQGVEPESGGWDQVPNVLWAIDASQGTLTSGKLASRAHGGLPEAFPASAARLYPSPGDLLPFLVMLGLQSGLPIECVASLRRDCLRNPAGGTVQIDHEKWRAGPSPFRSKRYPDAGLRTPGGIVRAVLEATERAARHSGSPWLFVAYRLGGLERPTFAEHGLEPWTPRWRPVPHPHPLRWLTHSKAEMSGLLEHYVARRGEQGRGIPCWTEWGDGMDGMINVNLVAAQIGTAAPQRQHHPEAFDLLERAGEELGLEPGGMDTPVSLDPATDRPWRGRFGPNVVAAEADRLRAACYVVCAYLSGMRDGEIMEVRRGAHTVERSADGVVNRHRLRSIVSKGRRSPEAAAWVVTEHVGRAVEVMERLDGGELVFASLGTSRADAVNRFRDHVNRLSDESVAVPAVDGSPWRSDTRQFRRTLAWFIGAQPFGVWAGAVQFKHLSVRSAMEGIGPTVFEGYVGTTPSGFPADVELARQAAADLYVGNLATVHAAGARSAGGGARRINARLEELATELGQDVPPTARPQVVDEQRRAAMLRSVSHNLFVGPLTDCFFDPDVALCLRDQDRASATVPVVGRCEPERCRNSRIGEHHLPAWQERLDQVRTDLRLRGLPPLQRRHLADQRDRLKAAIDTVRKEEG